MGSRFCSVAAADKVAQAFRDTVSFATSTGQASLDEKKLAKYDKEFVECFTKYKSTRERIAVSSVIRQWLKTWIIRGQQKRKRKIVEVAKDAIRGSWPAGYSSYGPFGTYSGYTGYGGYATYGAPPPYAQIQVCWLRNVVFCDKKL